MIRAGWRHVVAMLMGIVLAAGCNVYEGLYEEGQSDDPEALLADARIALQQDRPEAAVAYLRKALTYTGESTPLRKRVQIKLASAVLLVHDIDVLSFSRMARTLSGAARQGMPAGKAQSQTCNFPAGFAREAFDPRDGLDFERLGSDAGAEALAESQTLVARVFSGEETEANPAFPCDDEALDAAVADLQEEGLSNEEIAEALVDYAVALTTVAYLDFADGGGTQTSFYYVTAPPAIDYVGFCSEDEATCNEALDRARARLSSFDCATRIFQARAALLGSTSARELADLSRDSYLGMEAGLEGAACYAW